MTRNQLDFQRMLIEDRIKTGDLEERKRSNRAQEALTGQANKIAKQANKYKKLDSISRLISSINPFKRK